MRIVHREVITGSRVDFLVLGRAEALRFAPLVPHVIISITEPRAPAARFPESPYLLGMLRLSFHDATMDLPDWVLFSEQDAERITEFVSRHLGTARLIVCQCEGGFSRSAGVAAALAHWLDEDHSAFYRYYQPNRWVYAHLLAACRNHPFQRISNCPCESPE